MALTLMVIPRHRPNPPVNVIGVEADGTETPVTSYRWLVQEDLTYRVPIVAGQPQPDPDTLAVSFHKSYMPVVSKGCVGYGDLDDLQSSCDAVSAPLDPDKYYFISVLPREGYAIGGTDFKGSESPTVYANAEPMPTAQISILIFQDD